MFFGFAIKISQSLIFRQFFLFIFSWFIRLYLFLIFADFKWTILPNKCLFVSKQPNQCAWILFFFSSNGKNLFRTVCLCVMMRWTLCVERKIWTERECETAKPRYNLWLKSFSLLINFVVSVFMLVSEWVSFYTSILLICETHFVTPFTFVSNLCAKWEFI